jgi:hypothetical protein
MSESIGKGGSIGVRYWLVEMVDAAGTRSHLQYPLLVEAASREEARYKVVNSLEDADLEGFEQLVRDGYRVRVTEKKFNEGVMILCN